MLTQVRLRGAQPHDTRCLRRRTLRWISRRQALLQFEQRVGAGRQRQLVPDERGIRGDVLRFRSITKREREPIEPRVIGYAPERRLRPSRRRARP